MRTSLLFLLSGIFILSTSSSMIQAEDLLPGSRPVIEARNYKSLQAAIDALPEEGGLVQLPPGKFEIIEPLRLTRGEVTIQGVGAASWIHNTNQEGKPAFVIERADKKKVPSKERLWRVMLSNFRITGTEKSGHGIEANWIQELFLQGVTVSEHGGDGLHLYFCEEDARISDCLITYNKQNGIFGEGLHDTVVSANHFEENQDALRFIDGYNLCMTGNNIDDHLRHGVIVENTYGSVISGNMIEECMQGTGVILDRDCYGITVSSNVIAHNGIGVDLKDAHGCAVSANTFTVNLEDGLKIGPDSGRITVTGNSFGNDYQGDGQYRRRKNDLKTGGIVLEGTSNNVISGNQFSAKSAKAITVSGEENRQNLISNNLFTAIESEHAKSSESLLENNLSTDGEKPLE
ncbi:right-handed parallel beta-helix repeat-containing protein [Polystyrenella longa]|uniref:right-handed parallel beta-helix repeat-containing protein n=1 Tax=Polystyrenella longa TaxID=2528007 RepID=UPI0018D213EE|nr:right-handed parallel beta-helix repeat-containing protein [Polystyrenella longa]